MYAMVQADDFALNKNGNFPFWEARREEWEGSAGESVCRSKISISSAIFLVITFISVF